MKNITNSIVSSLKWKINSGVYGVSRKLPSENAIAIKYNCSRLTARKALQVLKEEKLVVSRAGKGYYISAGTDKLVLQTREGSDIVKVKFHYGDFQFDKKQKEIFESMDHPINKSKDEPFLFFKTQYDKNNHSFTVLHSMVNPSVTGKVNVEDIKKSFSGFLAKRSVMVHKRIEKIMIIEPPNVIQIKLNLRAKEKVVASYSVMLNDKNEVIEHAIRYTILSQYVDTFVKEY